MSTALIDGDIILYLIAHSQQTIYNWGDTGKSTVVNYEGATGRFDKEIREITEEAGCTRALICLTGSENFRYDVLPTYKHNRKDTPKPELHAFLKEHALNNYECKLIDKLEADDVMGVIASREPSKYVICSTDKDMLTIPAWVYNWNKMTEPKLVTEEEADLWFFTQILTGDTTDGYKGCPSIGIVKATKILEAVPREQWWEAIVETYATKGLTEEDALVQARVARILRATDYSKEKGVILWKP